MLTPQQKLFFTLYSKIYEKHEVNENYSND